MLSIGLGTPQSEQERKLAFLNAEVDDDIYSSHTLQDTVSPYQHMAGTIIPTSLITGLNSDLPGQVIAQVTENVYDTATGRLLLVPQGARVIGTYDSQVDFHTWRLLSGIALSTLLGVGTELVFGDDESDLVKALRTSLQDNTNQAGQQITERNLNIPPTLTIRPGWLLCIIVNKDIVLRPYGQREVGQ